MNELFILYGINVFFALQFFLRTVSISRLTVSPYPMQIPNIFLLTTASTTRNSVLKFTNF